MLKKDEILLTQPKLWAKAKILGKTIKYNQLLTPTLTSTSSVVPSANTFGSYITILEPSLVGHKVYVKLTADDNRISLGWYKNENGVMGYDLITGAELNASSTPSATEGVYEITSDMVHSGTNYLQLYWFVYSGLPTGSHTITVQMVDLTELGMENITNPVLFNATDLGKYMQVNTLNRGSGLASGESPFYFYKDNVLKAIYEPAQPLVLRSAGKNVRNSLGKQNKLIYDSRSVNVNDIGFGNGVYFRQSGAYIRNVGSGFDIELNSSHNYLIIHKIDRPFNNIGFQTYITDDTTDTAFSTGKYINVNDGVSIVIFTGKNKFRASHLYSWENSFSLDMIPLYQIVVDLTELGLDNLTAQQFYDQYHDMFEHLANGGSFNTVQDTFSNTNGKVDRKVGVVDLGTITPTFFSKVKKQITYTQALIPFKYVQSGSVKGNAISNEYKNEIFNNIYDGYTYADKSFAISHSGAVVYINDSSFTDDDTTATIRQKLSGVYIVGELATPTTENHSSIMLSNEINKCKCDNGIELDIVK